MIPYSFINGSDMRVLGVFANTIHTYQSLNVRLQRFEESLLRGMADKLHYC